MVCRRGGASAAFDRLNKYFTIMNMPVVSSQYWNMVYGQTPGQVKQDEDGSGGECMHDPKGVQKREIINYVER